MAWVESNWPRDCGIVCGDAECDDNSQRPPKPSHNHLGSYSRPRLSLFSKVGYYFYVDFILSTGTVGEEDGSRPLHNVARKKAMTMKLGALIARLKVLWGSQREVLTLFDALLRHGCQMAVILDLPSWKPVSRVRALLSYNYFFGLNNSLCRLNLFLLWHLFPCVLSVSCSSWEKNRYMSNRIQIGIWVTLISKTSIGPFIREKIRRVLS